MIARLLFSGPIDAAKLRVTWSDPPALSACARARIDHQWNLYMQEARQNGVTLFNGPTVALRHWRADAGALTLDLFAGDYKSFITTCVRDRDWFTTNAPEAISPALGNSALLTFRDSACLGVRGKNAALYPGLAHLFGGVPEHAANQKNPMTPADIVTHLARELHEEAGLSSSDFASPPALLGLFHEHNLNQPELVWRWELNAPLQNASADEHDAIRIVSQSADQTGLTPLAAAAIALWKR